jgi:hypothetical protein
MDRPVFPPNKQDPCLPEWAFYLLLTALCAAMAGLLAVNMWAGIVTHGGRCAPFVECL